MISILTKDLPPEILEVINKPITPEEYEKGGIQTVTEEFHNMTQPSMS